MTHETIREATFVWQFETGSANKGSIWLNKSINLDKPIYCVISTTNLELPRELEHFESEDEIEAISVHDAYTTLIRKMLKKHLVQHDIKLY